MGLNETRNVKAHCGVLRLSVAGLRAYVFLYILGANSLMS